jgi:hypothetical protein
MSIKRNIKYWWQRRTRGWSDDECWSIDYQFIVWLNTRLKVYLRDAPKVVNLEYHKFNYKGKEHTQLDLIIRLINITDKLKQSYWEYNEGQIEEINEVLDVFKLIFSTLWW